MKYSLLILCILCLNSCNDHIDRMKYMTSKDSLISSIQGSWKGYKDVPIWDIGPDSIFYYSENKSYYYFIHNNDMIVLYKKGPFKFKSIRVSEDTFFFKTGDLNANAFRCENKNPNKFRAVDLNNYLTDEVSNKEIKNKIEGEWGYEYKDELLLGFLQKTQYFILI